MTKYYPEEIKTGMTVMYNSKESIITKILPANNSGHYRTGFDIVVNLDGIDDKITLESIDFKK